MDGGREGWIDAWMDEEEEEHQTKDDYDDGFSKKCHPKAGQQ